MSLTPGVPAPHVIVVGGGISGLAAAHRLTGAGLRVTLLESAGRLGGKLHRGSIAGAPVDLGAEALLARRPEALQLARAVGLGDRLRTPASASAALWSRGALRPVPTRRVLSLPGDRGPGASGAGPRIEISEDVSLGHYDAYGYFDGYGYGSEDTYGAGDPHGSDGPHGAEGSDGASGTEPPDGTGDPDGPHGSAGAAGRHAPRARTRDEAPGAGAGPHLAGSPIVGVDGGVGSLPGAVAAAVRAAGGEIVLDCPALALNRTATGWEVRVPARTLDCDGVVIAAPAWVAATLLAAEAPTTAAELSRVDYASTAVVTMAFRRSDLAGLSAFDGRSGFLIPPVDRDLCRSTIKAATFLSHKWDWVSRRARELFVLRTSIGRHGEEELLYLDDADLVGASLRDLEEVTGLGARPVATEVTRWIDGLPQYGAGHPARVTRVRDALGRLPGLALCGAAYDGVDITDCVASGQRAADELIGAA
ncbi:FAD-dependent oxidoreductase [Streptomyces sp. LX-29]|uniref:protoporphyrinogen/coproporphyrinogen oxidase n=1 Tax=Streptomyces sp. LX-29 TaxID=2900152 RepID=UPI00240E0348|nr:FAD-dependent oxidoreductase [Streptomyces sp. LX-29]WFB10672.1 FAD-dependent oxidoreductase [Streptomyces sp. LX-29]